MRPRLAVALAAALLTLAACAADTTVRDDPSRDDPTRRGPDPTDAVVLRAGVFGGFVPEERVHTQQPTLLVTSDGRAFTEGVVPAIHPGPLVTPFAVGHLTADELQQILDLADGAGLLATPPDYTEGEPKVTDMPFTVLDLTTEEGSFHHAAYALADEETAPARVRLVTFLAEVGDRLMRVEAGPWQPTSMAVLPLPEQGGEPEGVEGEIRQVDWTGPPLEAGRCLVVDETDAVEQLHGADSLTRFRSGGEVWRLAVRQMLPGDPGCGGYRP